MLLFSPLLVLLVLLTRPRAGGTLQHDRLQRLASLPWLLAVAGRAAVLSWSPDFKHL